MALSEYRRKRDFAKTPEPRGKAAPKKAGPLSFVVQQHRARRLHYDFRLELDGVLKSWALPRGPSLDPGEKRLAVHVEDHPLDYGDFEGVIPKGQYGGGTILLWDRGRWTPQDRDPAAAYAKGALKFALDGEKLHGHWALVRMGGKAAQEGRDNWLLIKERDSQAMPGSGDALVDGNPGSVASGRSLDEIAAARDRVWNSDRGGETVRPDPARIKGARKSALPRAPKVQLASLAAAPPAGDDWLHEIKYDGYRILAQVAGGKARLLTRSGLDWTAKFPALAEAFAALPVEGALLDGELVAFMPDGTTSFARLQDAIASRQTEQLVYCAFDLLYLDGFDLTGAPLEERKAALFAILPPEAEGMLRYSDHQLGRGPEFFREACRHALEGIVSKRRDQPYRPGRGHSWLKVKCTNREEFVVIGFTDPAGSREGFGALLLGYYDRAGTLRYAGRVGTGFDRAQLGELRARLERIERAASAALLPKGLSHKGVHWVRPQLVAEIRYAGWTADAILRQSAFEGLREDKNAREVVREAPEARGK